MVLEDRLLFPKCLTDLANIQVFLSWKGVAKDSSNFLYCLYTSYYFADLFLMVILSELPVTMDYSN